MYDTYLNYVSKSLDRLYKTVEKSLIGGLKNEEGEKEEYNDEEENNRQHNV